jgi:hypothetical protein
MSNTNIFANQSSIISDSQYKYKFNKKWGWKKNITASTKASVIQKVQKRASMGKATVAVYRGNQIDPKKLRRHAKEVSRKRSTGPFATKGQAESSLSNFDVQFTSMLPHFDTMYLLAS